MRKTGSFCSAVGTEVSEWWEYSKKGHIISSLLFPFYVSSVTCVRCAAVAAGRNEGHVALDVVDLPALNFYGRK